MNKRIVVNFHAAITIYHTLYLIHTSLPFPDPPLHSIPISLSALRAACPSEHAYEMCRSIVGAIHFHHEDPELPAKVAAVFERYLFESEAQALAAAPRRQLDLLAKIEHPPVDVEAMHAERVATATRVLREVGWLGQGEELPETKRVKGSIKRRCR